MKRDILRQSTNLLAVLLTIVINGLANALPLNGQTTGEVSDRFHVYFVPAGYVFAIWGLIYIGLIAFAIYQMLPSQRDNPRLRRMGYIFALGCLANTAWLFLWHYEFFPWTLVAMFALLLSLIAVYLSLDIGRTKVPTIERWAVHATFSVYLGWITVATVANVSDVLDYLNWSGWGISAEAWTVIMLVTGFAIASAVSLTRGDIAYMLVIIWAFVGIAVKQSSTPMVATTAWVMAVLVALVLVVGALNKRRRLSALHG